MTTIISNRDLGDEQPESVTATEMLGPWRIVFVLPHERYFHNEFGPPDVLYVDDDGALFNPNNN